MLPSLPRHGLTPCPPATQSLTVTGLWNSSFFICVSLTSCDAGAEKEVRGSASTGESCAFSPDLADGNVSQQQLRGEKRAGHGQSHLNLEVTQGPMKKGESCMLPHARLRNRNADAAGCKHLFEQLWMLLSGGRSPQDLVRLRTVLHMWSQLSCSLPSHLLCPPRQLRAGEGSLPPLLTLCSPLPSGEVTCWPCAPPWWKQVSRQCFTHENDAAFRSGGGGRRALCLASLCFPPAELPSLQFLGWVRQPEKRRQPWPRTYGYSQEDPAGVQGGRAQPPAVSRRQN